MRRHSHRAFSIYNLQFEICNLQSLGFFVLLFAVLLSPSLVLAQTATTTRTTFEFGRLNSFTHVGHWALLITACLALLWFVWHMYRRDSVELRPGVGVILALLRIAAFAGLLVNYLDL